MRQEYLKAAQLFAAHTVLKMLPPPRNKTSDDLRAHIRGVLFKRGH